MDALTVAALATAKRCERAISEGVDTVSAVSFATEQELTDGDKEIARGNIDAAKITVDGTGLVIG